MLIGHDLLSCKSNIKVTIDTLEKAGFVINGKENVGAPTKGTQFLGFILNLETMTISLPPRKIAEIQQQSNCLLLITSTKITDLASFIGLIVEFDTIMGTAGWRNANIFVKYYDKLLLHRLGYM